MMKRKRVAKYKPKGLVKEKRPRLQLSDLPMDILHSIISRLPIREAVRTSTLSKHWKHVWCSRTNLKFSFKSMVYKKGSMVPRSSISEHVFIRRVDAVLKQHSGRGVERMEVDFSPLHSEHAEHIDGWVKFAIASKANQLVLDFGGQYPGKEPYSFPFQLFDATNGSYLQYMKLGSVSLKQPASIKVFLNLKKLDLVDVNVTDDELKAMLFNCNVVEFIGISRCRMLTCVHTPHPLDHLKHLHISNCPLLQRIELSYGLITVEYEGLLIPLAPPSTLRHVSIKSLDIRSALAYIFTGLPSTLPLLEMLTLRCYELKRATLLNKPPNFPNLRHLRLELNFVSVRKRSTDALDLAHLLEAAPLLENLEVHMWMDYKLQRYHKCHGELRSLPPHPHAHLKLVNITGFYGQKDQLELALHILRNSNMLEAMKIDPRPMIAAINYKLCHKDGLRFVDGYKVAKKYLRKSDRGGLVDVIRFRLRDVKNVNPYKQIDPEWLAMVADDE
ncbi:hypothetical protein ACP70R_028890 [Stipagrostis hirtigluma subsp. patula]